LGSHVLEWVLMHSALRGRPESASLPSNKQDVHP
jgi:hypothetical protein